MTYSTQTYIISRRAYNTHHHARLVVFLLLLLRAPGLQGKTKSEGIFFGTRNDRCWETDNKLQRNGPEPCGGKIPSATYPTKHLTAPRTCIEEVEHYASNTTSQQMD